MYQGSNGGWKKKGARSFSVLMPAYFHQQKEIYLYVRVEKNSVETKSYFTWLTPWWSLIGKWCELWGFYQPPMPSSASDLVFQKSNSMLASGHVTYPSLPGRAHRFSSALAFGGLLQSSGFILVLQQKSPAFGCNSECWGHQHCWLCQLRESVDRNTISPHPPGNIIFHTENNKILPRSRGNILKLFEVKENNCLRGKRI